MSTLLTGATGAIGGYVLLELLDREERVTVLVRGTREQAIEKLWKTLQLQVDGPRFIRLLERIDIVTGDLHAHDLGLERSDWRALADRTSSVIHNAATLNRMSLRSCMNTNVRGLLSVVRLAQDARVGRFSMVSAVAVAGEREREHVFEDEAIDWTRRTYDPYAESKRVGEHLVRELLPDVTRTIFRPPSVIGDARFPEVNSFDMIGTVAFLADMRVAPLSGDVSFDVANIDWVARAIAALHGKAKPNHEIYHLTAGRDAVTTGQIARAIEAGGGRRLRFAPHLQRPWMRVVRRVARERRLATVSRFAALLEVFWPYVTNGVTYDNQRVVQELGEGPTPFTAYVADTTMWARAQGFRYPYRPLPTQLSRVA